MNIDSFLATHADALRMRNKRTHLIASNIANADTPHYKARDISFGTELARAGGTKLALTSPRGVASTAMATHSRHIAIDREGALGTGSARVMYRVPESASLDGNTVDKDVEQSRFAENSMRYQASLEFLGSRVKGLIRALKGE